MRIQFEKYEKLTDKQLALAARNIEAERKLRANRKAATVAILRFEKHNLSVSDLSELRLGQIKNRRRTEKNTTKRIRQIKKTNAGASKSDRRSKATKYKNPSGFGNGVAAGGSQVVTDILATNAFY